MSINIHFKATRKIVVLKTGKTETQVVFIDVWQTPSDATRKIEQASDPVQAYIEWALSISKPETEFIYADDDVFQERQPVGKRTFNPGKDHAKTFQRTVEELKNSGYDILAESY